jgi:hypothetical protein
LSSTEMSITFCTIFALWLIFQCTFLRSMLRNVFTPWPRSELNYLLIWPSKHKYDNPLPSAFHTFCP